MSKIECLPLGHGSLNTIWGTLRAQKRLSFQEIEGCGGITAGVGLQVRGRFCCWNIKYVNICHTEVFLLTFAWSPPVACVPHLLCLLPRPSWLLPPCPAEGDLHCPSRCSLHLLPLRGRPPPAKLLLLLRLERPSPTASLRTGRPVLLSCYRHDLAGRTLHRQGREGREGRSCWNVNY